MDPVNDVEYNVRNLPTRSVTLFPTRAKVWRDIKDIQLKPGTNKIVVFGLSPTVEEDSIRVEGSGSSAATITDIAVEPLPNREIFEDVYPESDDSSEEEESESDQDSDEEERDEEGKELEAARTHLTELLDRQDLAKEAVASATWRLKILDAHGKSAPGKKTIDIEQFLDSCQKEREKACDAQLDGIKRQRSIAKDVDEARYRVRQLERKERKSKAKSKKEKARESKQKAKKNQLKAKERAKKARAKTEERKERARIRMEREKFWPRFCYSICITIEVNTFTPLSSRRSSVSGETMIQKDPGPRKVEDASAVEEHPKFDMLISYITGSAGWLPCYDLQLSTTSATGVLCFDAKLRNLTSETWSNCTFTLSTSQTTFFERDSIIPVLQPWRIQIAPKGTAVHANGILRNREEHGFHNQWQSWQKTAPFAESREKLFGVSHGFGGFGAGSKRHDDIRRLLREEDDMKKQAQQFTTNNCNSTFGAGNFNKPVVSMGNAGFGSAQKTTAGVFGTTATNTNTNTNTAGSSPFSQQKQTGGLFGSSNAGPSFGGFGQPSSGLSGWTSGAVDGGSHDVSEKAPADEPEPEPELETELAQHLDAEDSLIEETGFTTTFDLPGTSTLAPRSTATKRRVARITFSNVTFTHTVVAKYKPVAFLKASFCNASKMTLLRGQAILILDGSFMGRAWVPRCSAGDRFSLSLGADPAIKVVYPKPDVRRATTGLFNRENSSVYVRTISLHNTRASAGKATSLLVLDQIPVSEDERLKVELVSPRGLSVNGGSVPIEVRATDAKEDKSWGKATAELRKSGEVNWRVTLNAGRTVKLSLEYAVSLPTGENAIQN